MSEYIDIPSYFKGEVVECKIISDFMKSVDYLESGQININSLRQYYSLDNEKGIDLIDELKLRGFRFKLEAPSNLLNTIGLEKDLEIIYTEANNGKISKINRNIFNCFDYSNSARTDMYFNLIPIYAFENIMKDFNYELIKQEFIRYGYEVLSEGEIKSKIECIKEIHTKKKMTLVIPKHSLNEDIRIIIKKIIKANSNLELEIMSIRLQDILPENLMAETDIKRTLHSDNINRIRNLVDYDITRLECIRGVGEKSISEFKENLIEGIKKEINEDNTAAINMNELDISGYIGILTKESSGLKSMYRDTSLEEILPDTTTTDKSILKMLKKDEIISIYDLIDYDINKLGTLRSVGSKRMTDFIEVIENTVNLIKLKFEASEDAVFYLEKSAFEVLKDYKIMELNEILYKEKVDFGESISDKYVRDLQNIKYKDLSNLDNINIVDSINKLILDANSIVNIDMILRSSIPEKISERDSQIFYERVTLRKTLEAVGINHGVSRERIRQIEKNMLRKYNNLLTRNRFIKSLKINCNNKEFFHINDFKELIDKENYFIIPLIVSNNVDQLYYYEPLDRIYFNPTNKIDEKLKSVIKEIPDYGDIEEDFMNIIDLLSDILGEINYEDSIKILSSFDVKLRGTYYFKGRITRINMLEIIYKYVHKDRLTLNDEGAKLINKYFYDIFDVEVKENWRNWEGVTSRVDDMLLVGPRTYQHLDHIFIKDKVIQEIQNIIEDHLTNYDHIYANRLFDEIERIYPENNIYNKHHAYSLVKYYHSESFQTSTGNSLKISKKGSLQVPNTKVLYGICLDHGGIVDFDIIKKTTKWSNHRIEMAISRSEYLIKVGPKKCAIFDLLFRDNEKEIFEKTVKTSMKPGYTSTGKIYSTLIFDENMSRFMKENRIENAKEIASIIKAVDHNIEGHNVFMSYEDQDIKNIEDVVFSMYPNKVYRNQIIGILEELHITTDHTSYIIKKLITEKRYVQISREEYLNYENFVIDSDLVEYVVSFFDEVCNENGYVVPEDYISEITRSYGSSKHTLNPYTVSAILTQNGYKNLERFNSAYRYEILVLVKESEEYNDISYLIYNLIKNEYDGVLHETPVYDFLAKKGIYKLEVESYDKKLQLDAKQNNLVSVNLVGEIELKE